MSTPAVPSLTSASIHRGRIVRVLVALAVSLALVGLGACSANRVADSNTSGSIPPEFGGPAAGDASRDESAGDGDLPENVPPGGPAEDVPAGAALTEQIVRTGDITVDVDDITSAANRVTAVVDAAGGNIGSDQRYGDAADGSADLVLRVPPDRFDELLDTISDLGEELSRSVAAQDVSTVVADVDARVESLQNSVDRLLALAAQAVSVSDLITIESELSARQAELESLQAQQRALSDQVSLATLSVRLTASSDPERAETGFLAGLSDGWNALVDAGAGLITIVGLLLPWLILLAVIAVPLWFLVRRRRRTQAIPATATMRPPPAATAQSAEPISEPAGSEPVRPRE